MSRRPRPRHHAPTVSNATSSFASMRISDQTSPEFSLLGDEDVESDLAHEQTTAPVVLRDAFDFPFMSKSLPQYGVLGSVLSINSQDGQTEAITDPRVYINTNAPFSAVVCGVQGSGKSHTVGVLLESMMISDNRLGVLSQPLSALVLHFGESGGAAQPCEAAYQALSATPGIKPPLVRVYVSPSSAATMKKMYKDAFGDIVTVFPLTFAYDEIDAKSMLSMMSVSERGEPPLYIQIVLSILRELGDHFSFQKFKSELAKREFNPAQRTGLEQRMALLESFLSPKPAKARFSPRQITVVDLTDPFIEPASACSIFEIVTRIFLRQKLGTGKVLVVDEAHKYLTSQTSALTQTLLSITRQQRHLGIRTIISTQEPTVIPEVLLDLCNVTIMHRFSSSSWFQHLAKHVSSEFSDKAFDAVVRLKTGQAILLAPSGIGLFKQPSAETAHPTTIGRRYLIVKTRRRVTRDGGSSILVVGNSPRR